MTQATHAPFDNELSAFRPYGHSGDRWQVAPLHADGSAYGAITSNNLTREQAQCLAAAPDMLAALEIADVALRAHGAGSSWDREQVSAAIAKAKGVQS
jgi:hypothetical protein